MKDTGEDDSFRRPGWSTVAPRIVARDAKRLAGFVKQVFGATGELEEDRPTELWLDGSPILISEAGIRDPLPAFLYVYVSDTDATYRRAIEAGARSIEAPSEMPYGDRRCMVEDEWGNLWQVATYRPSVTDTTQS